MSQGAQTQFWYNFNTLKRDAIYINRYHEKIERRNRRMNIFSAIASSSSIGAWVIWKDLWFIWTTVIAASQVLTAVKPHLPFKAQLHALTLLGAELDGLALAAEEAWFAVSHGRLTEEETHAQTMKLKKKCLTAQLKSFKNMSLAQDAKLFAIAESEARDYMETIAGDDDGQAEATLAANDDQERLSLANATDGSADAQGVAAQSASQEIGSNHDRQTAPQE